MSNQTIRNYPSIPSDKPIIPINYITYVNQRNEANLQEAQKTLLQAFESPQPFNVLPTDFQYKLQTKSTSINKQKFFQQQLSQLKLIERSLTEQLGPNAQNSIQSIRNLYASSLALICKKEASRQTIHQQYALEHIRSWLPICYNHNTREYTTIQLQNQGEKAVYVASGMIITGSQALNSHDKTKSLDFYSEFSHPSLPNPIRFYMMHKYIGAKGGEQNLQFDDLKTTITHVNRSKDPNVFFIMLIDGQYFHMDAQLPQSHKQLENFSLQKKQELISLTAGGRSFVAESHELPKLIASIVEKKFQDLKIPIPTDLIAPLAQMTKDYSLEDQKRKTFTKIKTKTNLEIKQPTVATTTKISP